MPQVLAAVGAAVTWVTATAAAVGTAASMVLTYAGLTAGQIAALGTAASFAGQLAMSAATSALMAPSVGRGGSPVAFKADPSRPISGVMGRFGIGGGQLHANVWGKDNLYLSFAVALSLGPIQSIESFTANGTAVTFPNAQGLAAATEPYINKMWQTNRLGLPTDAYLSPPTGVSDGSPAMTEWTSFHTLPSFAHVFWTMKNNSKREGYQNGVPAPLWTLLGMKVWDPRLDSTYPGGVGTQRRTDWTTWTYSANPYLHALAWVRGHHKLVSGGTIDLTKRLAGVGAPDASIDIAAFVEGANVADTNTWAIAGEWTTADDKWQTLAAMLQAGGGVPISQGAQISCMVETPRTSLMTITGADIVGSVSLNVMASRRDRPNTVIPRVRLEAHKFEEVALGAVTSATYVTEDAGESRVIETPYRFVCLAKQGAELAGYGLANTRETLKGSIPCKPYLLGLQAGDAFTVTEPELGLSAQKFVVLRRSFDPLSAVVTLDVRSETDAKHAWALGRLADAPASPSLTAPALVPTTPATADWTITARPAETSGIQQPGLIVTGAAVGENIGTVLIEYGTSSTGPWEQAYSGPPTIVTVAINSLVGGGTYYVGITYWSVRGVPSAQLVKGPYTSPGLTSGDVTPITPGTVAGTPTLAISTTIVTDGSQISRLSGSWTAPANALSYVVEIDNGTVAVQVPVSEALMADRIVTTGPTYRYRVKAMSRTGTLSEAWSAYSASVAAGGDATAPGVVTSPVVAPLARRNIVSWVVPADADYSHLKLYRNITGVTPVGEAGLIHARVEGSSFTDTAVTPAVLYYYWAKTVDRTGNVGAITSLGSGTPSYVSVSGGDVSGSDVVLVTSLGKSADVLPTAETRLEALGNTLDAELKKFEGVIADQQRRQVATADNLQITNRIAVVNPVTGDVDLRDTAAKMLVGQSTLQNVVDRADEGLDDGGFIRQPIPRDVSVVSRVYNEDMRVTDDGGLVFDAPDGTVTLGQVLRVAEATNNLGHDSVVRRSPADGNLGGRYFLQKPLINTTLSGDLAFDVYQSALRIFDATTVYGVTLPFSAFQPSIGGRIVVSTAAGTVTGDVASTTALRAPYARIGNGATGFLTLNEGDATRPGYMALHTTDLTRRGYVGFSNGTDTLIISGENGYHWAFDQVVDFFGGVTGVTKAMVGLGSVDNTSDAAKPVSTAQQTALDLKAPLASPAFTGDATISGRLALGATAVTARLGVTDGGLTNPVIRAERTVGGGDTLQIGSTFIGGNTVAFNPFISGVSNGGFEIAVAGTQRLVMDATGCGVGTPTPYGVLHAEKAVADNGAYKSIFTVTAHENTEGSADGYNGTSASFGMTFRRNWSGGSYTNIGGVYAYSQNNWRGGLVFRTKSDTTAGGSPADRMFLTPSGLFGIGVLPTEMLTVAGGALAHRLLIDDAGLNLPGALIHKTVGGSPGIRLTTSFAGGSTVDIQSGIPGISNGGYAVTVDTVRRMSFLPGGDSAFNVAPGCGFHWSVNGSDVALLEANGRLSINLLSIGGANFDPASKVGMTGAETVAGVKTFSSIPVTGGLTTVGGDMNFRVDTGQGYRWKVNGTDVALLEASGRLSLNAITMGGLGLGEWADWTPTPTAESGTATGLASVYAEVERHGKSVTVNFAVSQTAVGSAVAAILVPLPYAAKASRNYFGSGKNLNTGGVVLVDASGSNLRLTVANAYPLGSGAESLAGSITYQCA